MDGEFAMKLNEPSLGELMDELDEQEMVCILCGSPYPLCECFDGVILWPPSRTIDYAPIQDKDIPF
jgi:hypothetical protein